MADPIATDDPFDEGVPVRGDTDQLVVDLEGYEGPLDVLLALAREQKVDITRISILRLADQYLDFIAELRRVSLEIAADYLVMAAWLAYLKSRLLLPAEEDEEDGLTGEEMAEALAFQLRRLEGIRTVGGKLMALPRLGRDVFSRGDPEPVQVVRNPVYMLTLFDLLKAYGEHRRKAESRTLTVAPLELYSVDDAITRLEAMLGRLPDWQTLSAFLPAGLRGGIYARSAIASTLVASLEMTRSGRAQIRQNQPFGPIYLRKRQASE